MGLRAGLDTEVREKKISCLCRGSNLGRPVSSHISAGTKFRNKKKFRYDIPAISSTLLYKRTFFNSWSVRPRCPGPSGVLVTKRTGQRLKGGRAQGIVISHQSAPKADVLHTKYCTRCPILPCFATATNKTYILNYK
jgi:hypothetical protein